MSNNAPFRVGVVLLDGFATLSFAAAVEPFRAANLLASEPLYTVSFISADEFAESSGRAVVKADHKIGDALSVDMLLIVAGGEVGDQPLLAFNDKAMFDWLKKQSRQVPLLAGVSGGPAILAKAGVMAQRRMTIHWDHAEVLREQHPELLLERSRYVMDRNRLTCAGGTAALDMLHALLSRQHSARFATEVSDWFLHTEIRRSEDAQRAGLPERFNVHNKAILTVIELMENHIGDPMDMAQLAKVAGLSSRQLNRLFSDQLNVTPISFYRDLRLDKAANLLKQTSMSVSEIAITCGFFDNAHFSRSFNRKFGCSPSRVRSKGKKGEPL